MVRATSGRRGQGAKAGIDLSQILRAAVDIDPADLTMQAVADRVGVDRKTVNHYVSDRKTLLRLVAREAFKRSFLAVEISMDGDWREATRRYGHAIAIAVASLGPLAGELRFGRMADGVVLRHNNALLARLVDAGFELEVGLRALTALTYLCLAHGEGVAHTDQEEDGVRELWLREVTEELSGEPVSYLSQAVRVWPNPYDERQLNLAIEIFIRGLDDLKGSST